jgi:hypothetical protein
MVLHVCAAQVYLGGTARLGNPLENNQQPKDDPKNDRRKWYDSLPVSKFTLVGIIWVLGSSFLLKSTLLNGFPLGVRAVGFFVLTVSLLVLVILMPAKRKEDDDNDSSTEN